ncbi:MAG: hypothetical protein GY722_14185 [bacterium]|nr:hypothetical protein [bacterium]
MRTSKSILSSLGNDWWEFVRDAWIAAGRPRGLDPTLCLTEPLEYDAAIIRWLEDHFAEPLAELGNALKPNGRVPRRLGGKFLRRWNDAYIGAPLWRQVIVFLAFAEAAGGVTRKTIAATELYSLTLGVPSVEVDRISDVTQIRRRELYESLMFAVLAIVSGLKNAIEDEAVNEFSFSLLSHTSQMLDAQWDELKQRYSVPEKVALEDLDIYINGKSRLAVAIFFPLAIESAFFLANSGLKGEATRIGLRLSRVRQLNDEIVDYLEDLKSGILTFPYLHALSKPPIARELRARIEEFWGDLNVKEEADGASGPKPESESFFKEELSVCRSLEMTAVRSLGLLYDCLGDLKALLWKGDVFSVSLLLNQRAAHLRRLEMNGWQEVGAHRIEQPRSLDR